MLNKREHTFQIPVMGTAFTIDTPLKVAKFGINSVVSLCDDELCEQVRAFYCDRFELSYEAIKKNEDDYRARRITAYLNLLQDLVDRDFQELKALPFGANNDLDKYFEMLPVSSSLKKLYREMQACSDLEEKVDLQNKLKELMSCGLIEVNIMTKLDRDLYNKEGEKMAPQFSDALSALRGFALSKVRGNIVFSAGFNRRLYAYIDQFSDFFPDEQGQIKKRVVVKVSDYRSSFTQGKFLAKKGIWVSEYRVESGLNCGGHAFATTGYLMGPILEEFKQKLPDLKKILFALYQKSLVALEKIVPMSLPFTELTVQGGIGTQEEHDFLLQYYQSDCNGWGTPFLLVPEVANLDEETRTLLAKADEKSLYLSPISPLGVPFNTVRGTASEDQKWQRFEDGKPGSPCPKGYLVSTFEGTEKLKKPQPVCKASRFYQMAKIRDLKSKVLDAQKLQEAIKEVVEKACLCEDLAASVQLIKGIISKRPLKTAVCPGPNLAYFSKISSLIEMVGHIYGRVNLRNAIPRSNMFVNELKLYISYFKQELGRVSQESKPDLKYLQLFRENLVDGIEYYFKLLPKFLKEGKRYQNQMKHDLEKGKAELEKLVAEYASFFPLPLRQ